MSARPVAASRHVLDAARKVGGIQGTAVPRWTHLADHGVTRPMWTAATDDLHRLGYVVKTPSESTVLTWGGTLGRLYALFCRPDASVTRPAPEEWPKQ